MEKYKDKGERKMEEQNNRFKRYVRWEAKVLGKTVTMDATFRLLNAADAQDMLSRPYGNQRTLVQAHIYRLAQAMRAGEFIDAVINPIFISDTGLLLDGQHRLEALKQTDCTIPFFVVEGLPEETFVYIDQNRTRTSKDALKIKGVRNPEKVQSVAKMIHQLMEGKIRSPRNEVISRMIDDYPDLEQAVSHAESMRDSTQITTAVGGTLYFLYTRWWPEESKKFFDILKYGDQDILSQSQHPITRLKKKIKKMMASARTIGTGPYLGSWQVIQGSDGGKVVYDNRWKLMMFIHQAFTAYRTGKLLRWKEDRSTIDDIADMFNKTITLRNSYTDTRIVPIYSP